MSEPRNKQQTIADAVVRAVKARRRLVETAQKGLEAPEELTADDIESVCRFVVLHSNCIKSDEAS